MPDQSEDSLRDRSFEPARKCFARELDALAELFAFAAEFYASNEVDAAKGNLADFVLEELFTNSVKYNAEGKGEIEVNLSRQRDYLEVSLTDLDSERFDPREAAEVAIDAPLEERTPGGLGIHLLKKFAKRIDYDYIDRRSRVTIYLDLG